MALPGQGLLGTLSSGATPASNAATGTTVNPSTGLATGTPAAFNLTTGWWVFFGLAFGILTSETQIAPVSLGILTVALLYQITQLIEGK